MGCGAATFHLVHVAPMSSKRTAQIVVRYHSEYSERPPQTPRILTFVRIRWDGPSEVFETHPTLVHAMVAATVSNSNFRRRLQIETRQIHGVHTAFLPQSRDCDHRVRCCRRDVVRKRHRHCKRPIDSWTARKRQLPQRSSHRSRTDTSAFLAVATTCAPLWRSPFVATRSRDLSHSTRSFAPRDNPASQPTAYEPQHRALHHHLAV